MSLCLSLYIYLPSPNIYVYIHTYISLRSISKPIYIYPSIHACMHAYMHTYVYTPSPSFFSGGRQAGRGSHQALHRFGGANPAGRARCSGAPGRRGRGHEGTGGRQGNGALAWRILGNVIGGFDHGMGTSKSMGVEDWLVIFNLFWFYSSVHRMLLDGCFFSHQHDMNCWWIFAMLVKKRILYPGPIQLHHVTTESAWNHGSTRILSSFGWPASCKLTVDVKNPPSVDHFRMGKHGFSTSMLDMLVCPNDKSHRLRFSHHKP